MVGLYRYESAYTTPYLVAQQDGSALTVPTPGNEAVEYNSKLPLVKRYCFDYSKIIDTMTQRVFVPYQGTETLYSSDLKNMLYRDFGMIKLSLDEDLLGIDSITIDGTALGSSTYRGAGGYPYSEIQFDIDEFPALTLDWDTSIVIVGQWGVHDNPNTSYEQITTLNGGINDSTTTVTVTSGTNLQMYQYILVDSELMFIENVSTNTLTVKRGVNGFTAAAHLTGANVSVWQVVSDVQELATRMVDYYIRRRNDLGTDVQILGQSVVLSQFSDDLRHMAERRSRHGVSAV